MCRGLGGADLVPDVWPPPVDELEEDAWTLLTTVFTLDCELGVGESGVLR